MDYFANDLELRLDRLRDVLYRDRTTHASLAEILAEAEAEITLLRRVVDQQFSYIQSDEQNHLLASIPREFGKDSRCRDKQAAYTFARLSLIQHLRADDVEETSGRPTRSPPWRPQRIA